MKTLLPILISLCCLAPLGCGDSNDLQQVSGQPPIVQTAPNFDNAQVTISARQGSLTDQQLTIGGVTELTLITSEGSQTVAPDQIEQILSNKQVQAVLKISTEPATVYPLSLRDPVYDAGSQTIRFSATPLDELPQWYELEETVLYGEGPVDFANATLAVNTAEEEPGVDSPPPLLGGAPGFQTNTVYYRYQESSGTAKLTPTTVEIKTPLSISEKNTVSGELKFDFPIEFVELSVRPTRNSLGFTLTANPVDVVPPDTVTVPYALTISTNTRPGTYGVPAFLVSSAGGFDPLSLRVQVVP